MGILQFALSMAIAVQLYGQSFPASRKVERERAGRDLPRELPALQPVTAQNAPQGMFRRGHFAAQLSGAINALRVARCAQSGCPSP